MDETKMKYYYQRGLWSIEQLDNLLKAGKITAEQYSRITARDS